jgi:3-hydroxyacyl-CoA dehydrogenase/enoyl-CoA hydratase/3-hydroxybutyryl-CoA epimerase/enoyl-CoA isomerase
MTTFFELKPLPDGLVILTLNVPGQKVNTFSAAVIEELHAVVTDLARRTELRGLLVTSGKPGQFVAGADLHELADGGTAATERWTNAVMNGHRLIHEFEHLPFPTVALINGPCLGGGTEWALAHDDRLAADDPAVRIGLPEVKIGLIPGWGGTQRLPRLIDVATAVEMITSGEPVDAHRAVEIGLVSAAVPADQLVPQGIQRLEELQRLGQWQERRDQRSRPKNLTADQLHAIFDGVEAALLRKTRGHYPAPVAALRVVREGIQCPLEQGLAIEQNAFLELVGSPIVSNLITQFFITTRLQKETGVDDPAVTPRPIQFVGVLGAGLMGAGIAGAHARRGIPAVMVDVDQTRVDDGLRRARQVVEERIAAGRATANDLAEMSSRLSGSTSRSALAECDLVIEAVTENEALKTQMIAELARVMRPEAFLASNTSTISITRLAKHWPVPERFAGMHFFSPVDRMQLVEVVRGEKTGDETVATLVALAKRIGKTPIVVRDCPGFLVNRILLPYMAEALVLLEEGIDMDRIDRIAVNWGMPVGPITLYDLVGLDTGLYAGEVLAAGYPDRAVATPLLAELVRAGRLGKKSGKGFRIVDDKGKFVTDPEVQALVAQRVRQPAPLCDDDISDRLFICLALEAVRAWEDRIVRQPGDLDMALLLGVNFPAFRGGPLRWCDTEGAANMIRRAKKWESLGGRYHIPHALSEAARHGTRFYAESC